MHRVLAIFEIARHHQHSLPHQKRWCKWNDIFYEMIFSSMKTKEGKLMCMCTVHMLMCKCHNRKCSLLNAQFIHVIRLDEVWQCRSHVVCMCVSVYVVMIYLKSTAANCIISKVNECCRMWIMFTWIYIGNTLLKGNERPGHATNMPAMHFLSSIVRPRASTLHWVAWHMNEIVNMYIKYDRIKRAFMSLHMLLTPNCILSFHFLLCVWLSALYCSICLLWLLRFIYIKCKHFQTLCSLVFVFYAKPHLLAYFNPE